MDVAWLRLARQQVGFGGADLPNVSDVSARQVWWFWFGGAAIRVLIDLEMFREGTGPNQLKHTELRKDA